MLDDSMNAYLGVYLDELDEQLQVIEESMLRLEQQGPDAATIQELFRAAHTLKGSSAAMGFDAIKELTHMLENVFDRVRDGRLRLERSMIDTVLGCLDYLKRVREQVAAGQFGESDIAGLIAQLEQGMGETGPSESCLEAELALPQEDGLQEDAEVWQALQLLQSVSHRLDRLRELERLGTPMQVVLLQIERNAPMKSVRAYLAGNNLRECGELVFAHPPEGPELEQADFDGKLLYVLAPIVDSRAILKTLGQLSQIEAVRLFPLHPGQMTGAASSNESPSVQPPAAASARLSSAVATAPPLAGAAGDGQAASPQHTVRVDVERLERLLNLVGEIMIDCTRLHDVQRRLHEQFRDHSSVALLKDITAHLSRAVGELQDGMMKTRMLPIEQLFNRFPRMLRDLAKQSGKQLEFTVEGKETELDRTLIEEIGDPLLHLLRNAADHGIELPEDRVRAGKPPIGQIRLKAAHRENMIVITIADDGKGIDPQAVRQSAIQKGFVTEEEAARMSDKELVFLIMRPGFSTARQITDISGRGVGMDIVRAKIEKLSGVLDIDTSPGEGTVFTIKLPLTLAIIRSLLVGIGQRTFAIPLVNVLEIVGMPREQRKTVQGQEVWVIRGSVLPLLRLHERLGTAAARAEESGKKSRMFVVVIGVGEKRIGLVVDRMIGNQEIVIKTLGHYVGSLPFVAGSTILGDGGVALILDAGAIAQEGGTAVYGEAAAERRIAAGRECKLVTFRLDGEQYALAIERVKEIMTLPAITPMATAPPHALGMMNLRGSLLPVYDMRRIMGLPETAATLSSRVMVVENGDAELAILVDQVTEVLKLQEADIESAPGGIAQAGRVSGICKTAGRFILVLQLEDIPELAAPRLNGTA